MELTEEKLKGLVVLTSPRRQVASYALKENV